MTHRTYLVCILALMTLWSLDLAANAAGSVKQTTTVLEVTSDGTPVKSVAAGTVITLTATVRSEGVAVTVGQVSLCDAAVKYCTDIHLLGLAQLTKAGTAVLKFVPGIGSHTYKAIFAGTPGGALQYGGSTSGVKPLAVTGLYPTTTAIAKGGRVGDYTLRATVTGFVNSVGVASPSGTVSFLDTSDDNQLLGAAVLGMGKANLSFLNSSNPPVGNLPWSATTADFNGDGLPDLAVANYGDGTVSILLGNGDGTFTAAPNGPITVPFDPESIVAADFNGDGIIDLVMENSYVNGVLTILLGNGDGTFTPAPGSPITVGGPSLLPGAVAVGDFNGDGIPDLVATNSSDIVGEPGTMTVLLGKGDGTFTPAASSSVTVGSTPISIAVGDFNGDGIPDLAMVNFADNNVTIFLGNGDGTFRTAPNSPVAVGSFPTSIAMADFSGNGILDLAVANSSSTSGSAGSVTLLVGKGNGTFMPATNPLTVGNDPWSVVVGDFNGDGSADLAVANNSDDTLTILLGKGNGKFTAQKPVRVGDFPQAEAVGDFNGDGISDLAVANSGSDTCSILLPQLTQTATAVVTGISPAGSGTHLVDASYQGDVTYSGSTSPTVPLMGSGSTAH
jgi:hypothetical protein